MIAQYRRFMLVAAGVASPARSNFLPTPPRQGSGRVVSRSARGGVFSLRRQRNAAGTGRGLRFPALAAFSFLQMNHNQQKEPNSMIEPDQLTMNYEQLEALHAAQITEADAAVRSYNAFVLSLTPEQRTAIWANLSPEQRAKVSAFHKKIIAQQNAASALAAAFSFLADEPTNQHEGKTNQ